MFCTAFLNQVQDFLSWCERQARTSHVFFIDISMSHYMARTTHIKWQGGSWICFVDMEILIMPTIFTNFHCTNSTQLQGIYSCPTTSLCRQLLWEVRIIPCSLSSCPHLLQAIIQTTSFWCNDRIGKTHLSA